MKSPPYTIERLRCSAVRKSLFKPTTLAGAIAKLGFVQADPIRSPARAQDLILRQRVKNYRVGELEERYSKLDIEEDLLYAYGFLPREHWTLLHPRHESRLTKQEQFVIQFVGENKIIHPRHLQPHLGTEREINAWGGYSKVSTRLLEDLHYRGHLRIAGREGGIKLYGLANKIEQVYSPEERLKRLVMLIATILSPISDTSLRATVNHLRYSAPNLPGRLSVVKQLVKEGALEQCEIDGVTYLWPSGELAPSEPPSVVRLLAPFDPLVWDRRRFEHFWDWAYRFEAYTPAPKRRLGYYAMPLLWRDEVIGWSNVSVQSGKFTIESGFVTSKPKDKLFRSAYDDEVSRLKEFLRLSQ